MTSNFVKEYELPRSIIYKMFKNGSGSTGYNRINVSHHVRDEQIYDNDTDTPTGSLIHAPEQWKFTFIWYVIVKNVYLARECRPRIPAQWKI